MPQPTTLWSQRNRPRRAGMPVDCFTGGALWNISINDKRTILLMRRVGKAALHTNATTRPQPPLLQEAGSVRCQQLWVYALYSRTSDSTVANEGPIWATQAVLYLLKWTYYFKPKEGEHTFSVWCHFRGRWFHLKGVTLQSWFYKYFLIAMMCPLPF